MSDRSGDPFDEIERVFDRMSRQFASGPFGGGGVPVDLRDEGDRFVLEADLPGFDPADIDLQVSDGRRVAITAEHAATTEEDEEERGGTAPGSAQYVVRERHHESASRTVTVPEAVDEERAEATYDAGVLRVTLPKRRGDGEGTDIPVS